MEVLGGRPVWSMADSELLPALDSLDAAIARLQADRLQVIARVEDTGYAKEVGARDCVELLSFRCRQDRAEAWRDVRLARALPRYAAVNNALAEGIDFPTAPDKPQHDPATAQDDARVVQDDPDVAQDDADVAQHDAGVVQRDRDTPQDNAVAQVDAGGAQHDAHAVRDHSDVVQDDAGVAPHDAGVAPYDAGVVPDGVDVVPGGGDAGQGGDAVREVRLMRTAHAVVIVSALERVRSRVPVEDLDVAEEQLVAMAAVLSPGDLRIAAKQICDLLDSDGPEPDELKAYDRESLTLNPADNGVKFKGYLANENAELLRALIHAGARPHKTVDGELDPRPRDKRQADALTAALTAAATAYDTGTARTSAATSAAAQPAADAANATSAERVAAGSADAAAGEGIAAGAAKAAGGESAGGDAEADARDAASAEGAAVGATGPTAGRAAGVGTGRERVAGYGAKANITVTIDLQDLTAATADAIGQLVYGDGLSAATIRRLACDANIIPLVLGSNSEPLDVGRSERLVNRAMRRALNARDKGCVVCGAPPVMCDAHHITHWLDGGITAVSNLALLCRRHHVDLHAGRWTVTITDGVVHVARPTWADPPPLRFRSRSGPAFRATRSPSAASPCPDPSAGSRRPDPSSNGPRPASRGNREAPTPPDDPWAESPLPATSPAATTTAAATSPAATTTAAATSPAATTTAAAASPAGTTTGAAASRWRADDATYAEAARFAVWGQARPAERSTGLDPGPPSFVAI